MLNKTSALKSAAEEARSHAYAPYSKFAVGAAIETRSGQIFRGCNIENRSFGLTTCAEQSALAAAIAAGEREFVRLLIVTGAKSPTVPCGRCRQLLAEFAQDLEIESVTMDGKSEMHRLSELLPLPRQGILDSE